MAKTSLNLPVVSVCTLTKTRMNYLYYAANALICCTIKGITRCVNTQDLYITHCGILAVIGKMYDAVTIICNTKRYTNNEKHNEVHKYMF